MSALPSPSLRTSLSRRFLDKVDVLAVVLLVALAVPLIIYGYVGWFTRYMADDYCTAAVVQAQGFWPAQAHWYTWWSGRYAFTFAVSAIELLGPGITAILPALGVIAWLITITWTLGQMKRHPRARHFSGGAVLMAALIVFFTLEGTPNVPQSLFWQTGMVTYTMPLILTTAYAGLLIRWSDPASHRPRFWMKAVLSAAMATAIGGFSEVAVLLQIGALGLAVAGSLMLVPAPLRRRIVILLVAGLAGSVLAAMLVVYAPGTRARLEGPLPSLDVSTLAEITLDYTIGNLGFVQASLARSPVGWLLAVLLPALLAMRVRHADDEHGADFSSDWRKAGLGLMLIPIVTLVLVFVCFLATSYAVLTLPPDRVLIIQQYVVVCALAGWGYLAGLVLRRRARPARLGSPLLVIVLLVAVPHSIRSATRTLELLPAVSAQAATWAVFDRGVREAKAHGATAVTLPAPDDFAGLDVIGPYQKHWTNTCASDYYGLSVAGYPPPPVPGAADLNGMTSLDADIGGVARVVGYAVNRDTVRPGESLDVTVHWLPQAATQQPYTVFVHLYDPVLGSIAQQDTYPLSGKYATTMWAPGRAFLDTYTLNVSDDAPIAGDARLVMGLYDLQTMQRLPVSGRDAGPEADAWVEIGSVQIQP